MAGQQLELDRDIVGHCRPERGRCADVWSVAITTASRASVLPSPAKAPSHTVDDPARHVPPLSPLSVLCIRRLGMRLRRSGPSHCPSVTMSSDPLLLARAATARPREGVTAPPESPRTTTSKPSSRIAAQSIAASLGWGHEGDLRQVATLLVEGEEPESGHSDHRHVPTGSGDSGEESDQDRCCAVDTDDGSSGQPAAWGADHRSAPERGSIRRVDCAVATIGGRLALPYGF